jgi:hypothetical protein
LGIRQKEESLIVVKKAPQENPAALFPAIDNLDFHLIHLSEGGGGLLENIARLLQSFKGSGQVFINLVPSSIYLVGEIPLELTLQRLDHAIRPLDDFFQFLLLVDDVLPCLLDIFRCDKYLWHGSSLRIFEWNVARWRDTRSDNGFSHSPAAFPLAWRPVAARQNNCPPPFANFDEGEKTHIPNRFPADSQAVIQ